jgi:hypothetical protein
MIYKLMSLIDIMIVGVLFLLHFNFLVASQCIFFALYLIIKCIGFWGDFASKLDGICGIYMIMMFFGLRWLPGTIIAAIWIGQKGFFGLRY